MNSAQIKHMVDRFLGWRLPKLWNPDGGISYRRPNYAHAPADHDWPTGTNLFDATQAEAMVRHLIEGLPATQDGRDAVIEDVLAEIRDYQCGVRFQASDAGAHNDKRQAEKASYAVTHLDGLLEMIAALKSKSPIPDNALQGGSGEAVPRAYFSLILDLLRWASMGTPVVSAESIETDLALAIDQTKAWLNSTPTPQEHGDREGAELARRVLADLESGDVTGTEIALSNAREAIEALRADLDAKQDVRGLVEALKKIVEVADNEDCAEPLDFIFKTASEAIASSPHAGGEG